MNFIKKKLKSHKKDDEEEEYEKAMYEQSLRGGEKVKNTEEWQFFQQLSMRVQDTVQKTQTTLNKLKDVRQDSISGKDDFYDFPGEGSVQGSDSNIPFGTNRIPGAPPRPPPPPPSADKALFSSDGDTVMDTTSSLPYRGPPRPPLPATAEKAMDLDFFGDDSILGTSVRSSPARPPPPSAAKPLASQNDFSFANPSVPALQTGFQVSDAAFSLLDEFGFQSGPSEPAPVKGDFQDLLFLDVKDEVDPFDTSFVDVSNIGTSHSQSLAQKSEASEIAANPFSKSSSFEPQVSHRSTTNPFFAASDSKSSSTEIHKVNESLWSSHNPFSDNKLFATNNSTSAVNGSLLDDFLTSDDKIEPISDSFLSSEMPLSSVVKKDANIASNIISATDPYKLDDILSSMETTTMPDYSSVENDAAMDITQIKWTADEPAVENDVSNTHEDTEQTLENGEQVQNSADTSFISEIHNPLTSALPSSSIQDTSVDETDVFFDKKPALVDNADASDFFENGQKTDNDAVMLGNKFDELSTSNDDLHELQETEQISTPPDVPPSSQSFGKIDSEFNALADEDSIGRKSSLVKNSFDIPETCESFGIAVNGSSIPNFPLTESEPFEVEVSDSETSQIPVVETEKFKTANVDSEEFGVPSSDSKTFEQLQPVTSSSDFEIPVTDSGSFGISAIDSDSFGISKTDSETFGVTDTSSETVANAMPATKPFMDSTQPFSFSFKENKQEKPDKEFDAFSAKFESAKGNNKGDLFDPFSGGRPPALKNIPAGHQAFGSMDEFDPFKIPKISETRKAPPLTKDISRDSFDDYDAETDFSIVIKPKVKDFDISKQLKAEPPPKLLPPPKTPTKAFDSTAPRFNPFDKDSVLGSDLANQEFAKVMETEIEEEQPIPALGEAGVRKTDSIESPLSPLFDEDTSLPLEVFPKPSPQPGWEMVLRQPNKKKLTGNRFWKKIYVKLSENSVLQLYNKIDDKLPFQELPLQASYSLSEIGAQQYDQYGKIFTVKLQYKFYRERVGVRPGQISKVTQGQVTSMGDVARLGLPLQHSPQTSQLLKMGTHAYSDIKFFIQAVEDALFRMVVHRDRVLTYKTEEIQVIAQDEFYVEQTKTGHVEKQLARVRIFFLAFITGMPSVEVGLNDINRQGKEVVGRYDIIPVVTEEWIRLEDWEFHSSVNQDEFYKTRTIKFVPPDACLFELLQFRIRPPRNRELPLQVRVFMTVSSSSVEIRSDILVPGYSSRKQGQIPCENIQIRFPIPECWIYLFRTEKHFRYGSKKSAARRPGKIKGLERIIGAAQNLDPSLIEVSAGQAKYEHVFHAVVWRIPRLPKEGQGAYTQQLFLLRTELTSFDQIPESFDQYVDVEFTMPATYVSHTTVRSVSVSNPDPPEKYVRYISKHEYKVEIDFKSADEIEALASSPNLNVPVTTATAQETPEDEKDDDYDSD